MNRQEMISAGQTPETAPPIRRRDAVRRLPGVRLLLRLRGGLASWWFDASRHVNTRGHIQQKDLNTPACGGFDYLATFAHVASRLLRNLPPIDHSHYTFIDLGSGKGRMLFAAAEYPFRRIVGIEYASELHDCAVRNIQQYRHPKRRCAHIESLNLNALDYELPDDNLVIYLFNPFGSEVMRQVLRRLKEFIASHDRDVILVLLHCDSAPIADLPDLRLHHEGFQYRIYRRS